jgi:tetratricopeptide (TPR) repeat protein
MLSLSARVNDAFGLEPTMEPTPSVMNPQSEFRTSAMAVRVGSRPGKRTVAILFLGIAILSGVGVYLYAMDPWAWRIPDRETSAAKHWEEAQKAMEDREFSLAQKNLAHCLQIWPFNAEAHFLLARACRREQGPFYLRPWQQHLMEAAQLQWPKEQIDFEIQLQQAQMGDVWSVEPALQEALQSKSGPEVEMVLEALAEGYLRNHSLAKMLDLTGPWIERSPEAWLPHLYRAHMQYREGSRTQAIEEYRTVLKLNPVHSGAQLLLAGALMDDGQFKEALAMYQAYLQENPGDAKGLFGLANCQFSLSKTAAARAALKEILAVSKDDVKALFLQAKIEFADDKPAESLKWLRKAERLAPRESDITHTMIVVLQRLNRTEETEKYVKRQQEILDLHDQLGKLYKQLRREPSNPEVRFQIGRVFALLSRDDESYEWFQTALRLDPTHAQTLQALEEWKERNPEAAPQSSGKPTKN